MQAPESWPAQVHTPPKPADTAGLSAAFAQLATESYQPFQTILDQIPQLIDCEASAVLLLAGHKLEVAVSRGFAGSAALKNLRLDPPAAPDLERLILAGQPLIVADASADGPLQPLARAHALHACIMAPLQYGGRSAGCLLVFRHSSGAFGDRDALSAMAVANQLAMAIENARLYVETQRRAQQLEAASEVSRRVTSILDLNQLLAQIVGLIRETLAHDHVDLFLVEGHTNEVVLREVSGQADEALRRLGLRLKIGEQGIIGWVAATGEPLLCNDVSQEPRYLPHELVSATQSELAVPLRVGDVVVGVLDVQSNRRGAFHPDDLTALQILADQVATAIENAHLFQETRRQVETMRVLHDISLTITTRLAAGDVLPVILQQAARLLGAQASSLAILDPDSQVVRMRAIHNLPQEIAGAVLKLGEGVAGQVVATGEAQIVNDYQHSRLRSPVFKTSPFDAVLGVPLRWEDQVFGALSVVDRAARRPFIQDDVQVLRLFADLASIALKKAELYAQLRRAGEELEQKVARRTEQLSRAQTELARKADELQRVLAITVRVQEEERSRIARDLHDNSNQLLAGTLYELQAAQESLISQHPQMAVQKLETAKGLLRRIEAENRQIIAGLRPPVLDAQGLVPALNWQATNLQRHHTINCVFRVAGQPARLRPEAELAVFRIVQEALNNVVTHAQARLVRVRLEFQPRQLRVTIEDDGVGFDAAIMPQEPSHGIGLIGIQERAQSVGGRLQITSQPAQGTRILLEVPLPPEAGAPGQPTGRAALVDSA
ncbi:MAG: GAF domain-containing protein [Anaerolineales bacterium]|nr:GAF domain-containing protein [Anaerolineales bacterium]